MIIIPIKLQVTDESHLITVMALIMSDKYL